MKNVKKKVIEVGNYKFVSLICKVLSLSSVGVGRWVKREIVIVLFNNFDVGILVVEYFYWLVYEVLIYF